MEIVQVKKIPSQDLNSVYSVCRDGVYWHFRIPSAYEMTHTKEEAETLLKEGIKKALKLTDAFVLEIANKPNIRFQPIELSKLNVSAADSEIVKALSMVKAGSGLIYQYLTPRFLNLEPGSFLYKTINNALVRVSELMFDVLYKASYRLYRLFNVKFFGSKLESLILKIVPEVKLLLPAFLSVSVREEDFLLGIEDLYSEIEYLKDVNILAGHITMPSIATIDNLSGNDKQVFVIFANVLLKNGWEIDANKKLLTNTKTKKSHKLALLVKEGGCVNNLYNNEEFPYQSQIASVIDLVSVNKEYEDVLVDMRSKEVKK